MKTDNMLIEDLKAHGFVRDNYGFYIKRHDDITVEVFELSLGVIVITSYSHYHAYVTSIGDIKQLLVKNDLPYNWI